MNKYYDLKKADYYIAKINELINKGQYWKASDLIENVNQFMDKSKLLNEAQILYSKKTEDFLDGMACCLISEECCSSCGGCTNCGGGLCAAFCLSYCCTDGHPAMACDAMCYVWNNCFLIDILFPSWCKC